jgi:hypothetical protein
MLNALIKPILKQPDHEVVRPLEKNELASMEGLGIARRRAALHTANPTKRTKCFFIEPVLVPLGLIAVEEHLHFSADLRLVERNEDGWVPKVAVKLGDLIL